MVERMRLGGIGLAMILAAGCGHKAAKPAPLQPTAFQPPAPTAQPAPPQAAADAGKAAPAEGAGIVAPASVSPPVVRPATQPGSSLSSGTYLLVGTVIAEVNGKAVYADKVLGKVEPILIARAKELDQATFRTMAQQVLRQRVEEVVHDELEFAAAQRNNTAEDEQIAAGVTTRWRQEQITRAGGALAVAQRQSLHPTDGSQGMDFEERVREEYRRNMVRIYYTKRVWPRVQVLADDLRWYYDHNLPEFTEKAAIRFRVIRKGAEGSGTREQAFERIKDIRERAKRGEDFVRLARTENDNRAWAKNGGFMDMVDEEIEPADTGNEDPALAPTTSPSVPTRKVPAWYEKGTLRATELENALFALSPGQITEIIDGKDGFFYVAKLEEKKDGRVRPFEDRDVQAEIRRKLETRQRQDLRRKEQMKLMASAVVRLDEKQLQAATDMAMQRYGEWRGK